MKPPNKPTARFVEKGRKIATIFLGLATGFSLYIGILGTNFNGCGGVSSGYDVPTLMYSEVNDTDYLGNWVMVIFVVNLALFIYSFHRLRSNSVKVPHWYLSPWL